MNINSDSSAEIWKLYYFTGPGCQVCKVLEPGVRRMVETSFPAIEYTLVDASAEPETAARHGIFTVPAIVLTIGGREYIREIRHFSVSQLEERIRRLAGLSA